VHDHTIAAAPGSAGWTPFMHGYYVICSAEGISTGACEYSLRTIPGGEIPLALSVNGEPLTAPSARRGRAVRGCGPRALSEPRRSRSRPP
jgi:hypothetical protein